jgi:hypothetical protein
VDVTLQNRVTIVSFATLASMPLAYLYFHAPMAGCGVADAAAECHLAQLIAMIKSVAVGFSVLFLGLVATLLAGDNALDNSAQSDGVVDE